MLFFDGLMLSERDLPMLFFDGLMLSERERERERVICTNSILEKEKDKKCTNSIDKDLFGNFNVGLIQLIKTYLRTSMSA